MSKFRNSPKESQNSSLVRSENSLSYGKAILKKQIQDLKQTFRRLTQYSERIRNRTINARNVYKKIALPQKT